MGTTSKLLRLSARIGWLAAAACSAAEPVEPPLLAEPVAGYPAGTTRLTLRLDEQRQKECHATLVAPDWALTAAHCFSGVDPAARGALLDFGRTLGASDAVLHPGALPDGSSQLNAVWASEDFTAAHDLALLPIEPPLPDVPVPALWQASPSCTLASRLDVIGRFGKFGPNDEAQTAEAALLAPVDASALLGPEHSGVLLSAQGPSVGPGDSGSGVTASWAELESVSSDCEISSTSSDEVLVGVIQNANAERSTSPFGLIPLYVFDHAEWLATIVGAAPPPPKPSP